MRQEIAHRKIKYVFHFTRASHVPSILTHGLVPRAELAHRGIHAEVNDQHRFDGHPSANCCSIGHPNYKMFYRMRINTDCDWAVLIIDARVLWEKDCAFCTENAASNNVNAMPIQNRKGLVAFRRLFDEVGGKPTRSQLGLADGTPTNPQAEILIFDTINQELILGVACLAEAHVNHLRTACGGDSRIIHAPVFFSARKDYEHWR